MSLFLDISTVSAVIGAGASLSAAVNLGKWSLVGIVMPASWTTADLTFQASADGTTFGELVATDLAAADAVAAVQVHTPAVGQFIILDPTKFRGINVLKVRSGTSGSPVNQTGGATLTLVLRGIS